jgi:hypothetical protein
VAELLITWVPVVLLVLAAVFFIWNPWGYTLSATIAILVGLAITVAVQEYFCFKAPSWARARAAERGAAPAPADIH